MQARDGILTAVARARSPDHSPWPEMASPSAAWVEGAKSGLSTSSANFTEVVENFDVPRGSMT